MSKLKPRKAVKPRKMWTNAADLGTVLRQQVYFSEAKWGADDFRVLIIPLDPESVAALCEKVAKAASERSLGVPWSETSDSVRELFREEAQAALAAIGIKAETKRKARK